MVTSNPFVLSAANSYHCCARRRSSGLSRPPVHLAYGMGEYSRHPRKAKMPKHEDERESLAATGSESLRGSGFENEEPDPGFADASKSETEGSTR